MNILVTGGAGFIGSHIVDALVGDGHHVLVIDSLDPGAHQSVPGYLNPGATYLFSDLRHLRFDERLAEVEAIVHLAAIGGVGRAAKEPENLITCNAGGTARLVEMSRSFPGLKRFVLASSFSVYGSNYQYRCKGCGQQRNAERTREDMDAGRFEVMCRACGQECEILPIDESAPVAPLELYGSSKFMQELCLRNYHVPVHIMRFSSVYGRRMRLDDGEATIIAKLAGWIGSGVAPTLFEDGNQIRDWVHVDDIVASAKALLTRDSPPGLVNVCSGAPFTLRVACQELARAQGTAVEAKVVGGYRPGDMRHCLGDASTVTKLLGRAPIPFARGVVEAFGKPVPVA